MIEKYGRCGEVFEAGKERKMSVRKYRVYLWILVLAALIAGGVIYFYNAEHENEFENGTLVQNLYLTEEEPV